MKVTVRLVLNVKYLCVFMIISCCVLFRMRRDSGKTYRDDQHTHFIFHNFFFLENHAIYEIM